tara:strand:+ start:396 stop:1244 length:849 start_codon:yes stop_codon:yes gene_type:complete
MQNSGRITTVIIGERSNLSYNLSQRINHSEVFSSTILLESQDLLSKFSNKKINIIFNNFQPSTQLNSFQDSSKYIDLSISLTVTVLMYLVKHGAIINQIIYTSSCSVYGGISRNNDFNITSPQNIPSSLKYLNEQFLKKICSEYRLKLIIARIFNMYGGKDKFSIINKIISSSINKTNLTLINEGKSIRDYIHINNVVDVYEKVLLTSKTNFDIIDIGSGKGKSLEDILFYLSKNGYPIKTESVSSSEIDTSIANISKIEKIIDINSFIDVNSYLIDKLRKF